MMRQLMRLVQIWLGEEASILFSREDFAFSISTVSVEAPKDSEAASSEARAIKTLLFIIIYWLYTQEVVYSQRYSQYFSRDSHIRF
jgi:hypothetical protein